MNNNNILSRFKSAFSIKNNFVALFRTSDSHLRPLDGLRAFSILYVLIFHTLLALQSFFDYPALSIWLTAFPSLLGWLWHGDKGVDIFFVLSGFLIGSMLFKEYQRENTINLKRFYYHRLMRLMPAYLLVLGLLYVATGGKNGEYIWANILYVNNFLPTEKMFMPWSWSLAVEEQFYILFPLFLLLFFYKTQHRLALLIFLFAVSIALRGWLHVRHDEFFANGSTALLFYSNPDYVGSYGDIIYANLYTRYGAIICGIAAAYLHCYYHKTLSSVFRNSRALYWLLFLMAIMLTVFPLSIRHFDGSVVYSELFQSVYATLHRNVFSLGIAMILLFVLYPKGIVLWLNKFLSLSLWRPIAQLAYSTYLFHILILAILFQINKDSLYAGTPTIPGIALFFLELVAGSLLIAFISYLFVEKPFMNLRRKPVSLEAEGGLAKEALAEEVLVKTLNNRVN